MEISVQILICIWAKNWLKKYGKLDYTPGIPNKNHHTLYWPNSIKKQNCKPNSESFCWKSK